MGGTSSQNTATNQTENNSLNGTTSQTSNPWVAAQPFLNGILGQLNPGGAGLTGGENNALNTLQTNGANAAAQWGPQINGVASGLMNGGGATSTNPMVQQAYQDYQRRLGSTADGSQIGQNSGLLPYLDTLKSDITNQVNGQFAGAGRDLSGSNSMALGRGISQGLSPVIAGQYNTDVSNMMGAAGSLYGAGNTTSGILAGNNQQANANRVAGAGLIPGAMDVQNAGGNAELQAEAARRGIPMQALGLLAQIGIPIAGLGGTQTGTTNQTGTGTRNGTSNTQNQMSGAQQFATIAGGIRSLIPSGPMSFSF